MSSIIRCLFLFVGSYKLSLNRRRFRMRCFQNYPVNDTDCLDLVFIYGNIDKELLSTKTSRYHEKGVYLQVY